MNRLFTEKEESILHDYIAKNHGMAIVKDKSVVADDMIYFEIVDPIQRTTEKVCLITPQYVFTNAKEMEA